MQHQHTTLKACGASALATLGMAIGTATIMAACSSAPMMNSPKPPPMFSQDKIAEPVRVPAGNVVALETTATGTLNYECKANSPTAGTIGWVLVSPQAMLYDREGKQVGTYAGPPATWTLADGSSVVGTQVAIAPVVGSIHIPLQLSKAAPGAAPGMMQNITYVQRVNTKNGQDFPSACTQADLGKKIVQPYQADYIFWKAG
jgi:Protein of unknown function (DUF3455)